MVFQVIGNLIALVALLFIVNDKGLGLNDGQKILIIIAGVIGFGQIFAVLLASVIGLVF